MDLTTISLDPTLGRKSTFHPKIHMFKITYFKKFTFKIVFFGKFTFLTKFSFSKLHFSQKSHFRSPFFTKITFQNLIFSKNLIFKISYFTKITFKHQIQVNLWTKSVIWPQCGPIKSNVFHEVSKSHITYLFA